MCDKHNNERVTEIENNNFETKASNVNQQLVQVVQQQSLDNSLKVSIYDWDSPSSSTGTVKRRPHTIANFECSHTNRKAAANQNNQTVEIATNNNVASECQSEGKQSQQQTSGHVRRQSVHHVIANKQSSPSSISINSKDSVSSMQKSARSNCTKEKPQKLRLNKTPDRNANSTSNSPSHNNHHSSTVAGSSAEAQGGTIRKSAHKRSKYSSIDSSHVGVSLYHDENYMEFEFFEREIPNRQMPQFTELFRDFPVSYETTTLALQSSTLPAKPPPYTEPPPPTPPPLSQLPSRNLRNNENTQSCPSTPFRGKVVLSKKERKELSKLNKLQDTNCSNSTSNIRGFEASESPATSVQSSPYRGRVTELKNCIARINSRGLFASLHRNSQKSLNNQTQTPEDQRTSSPNEISPPPPAPDSSPPGSNASNNNDADYTEKLKNLPVRQRKGHTSHMDNYCLFDPTDFVNEKALRRRTHESLNMDLPLPQQQQGLRDPLFSSRQNLDFSEEELVPEVIYDEQNQAQDEQLEVEVKVEVHQRNFDHHNYFVIDPDDFEIEPEVDIGIPNPYTNEQLVQANLTAHTQHTYANNPVEFKDSEALEELLDNLETARSMTNSQESKDTTTTTSTALVESSSSTNSNTSSTSNTSSQTTLQRTKKRLTFLNLSPFRSNKTDKEKSSAQSSQPKHERAMSELVTSEHMFHLQRMLLSADNVLNDTHPVNENVELNYVLFNPGPVPSRNIQYKIRKPRPLSSHSDADSGFLSPCSPDEFASLKFNPALLVLQQCDSVQGYIEIYTDWANYYLERSKSKKKVTDLSSDCRDGLLLAEVIEAVTAFKVPDLHKKPKNQQQMYDNVNSCLNVLRSQTVAGLDNITSNDICCGRLKAVLALFFALSRYKQQSKQSKCNNATPALSIKADIHQQPNTTTSSNNTTALTNTCDKTTILQNANVVVGTNTNQQQQHVQSIQNGNDTMVNRSKHTNKQQMQHLLTMMEANADIACGFTKGSKEALQRFWRKVETELNSMGPPTKCTAEWKKVWADQKKYVRQKAAQNLRDTKSTGGGPNKEAKFSLLEEGIYNLVEMKSAVEGVAAKTFGINTRKIQKESLPVKLGTWEDEVLQELDEIEKIPQNMSPANIETGSAPLSPLRQKIPTQLGSQKELVKSSYEALQAELNVQKELVETVKIIAQNQKEQQQNTKRIYRSLEKISENNERHFKRMEKLKMEEVEELRRHNAFMEKQN